MYTGMYILIFFCLLSTIVCVNLASTPNRTRRIVGSTPCDISKHPYMVNVIGIGASPIFRSYSTITAILLTNEWLVTSEGIVKAKEQSEREGEGHYKILAGKNYQIPKEGDETADYDKAVQISKKAKEDEVALIHITPPFNPTEEDHIKGAKLPPTLNFKSSCTKGLSTEVTLVGWGALTRPRKSFLSDNFMPTLAPEKTEIDLHCAKAKIIPCQVKTLSYTFCVELLDSEDTEFCPTDGGMAVICKEVLIGITTVMYWKREITDCSKQIIAVDVAQYMTWLHVITGVKVAFQSKPNYNPISNPEENFDKAVENNTHYSGASERRTRKITIFSLLHLVACCIFIYFIYFYGE